jgi:hypothetical protein
METGGEMETGGGMRTGGGIETGGGAGGLLTRLPTSGDY